MPEEKAKAKQYFTYDQYGDNIMVPVGPLIVIPIGASKFCEQVNAWLYDRRQAYFTGGANREILQEPGFLRENYLMLPRNLRLETGEGRIHLINTVRGHDVFIVCDVMNYSETYEFYGSEKAITPDEHYQDLKRIILACSGKARRINVIMPFLYESRQHRKNGRESLDAAYMLEELQNLGVNNVITFDAHDPRVANAVPLLSFESIPTTYQTLKRLCKSYPDLEFKRDKLMIISPDEGGVDRAMYYASMLGLDFAAFYKRRDYSQVVNGRNPIIAHEFLGDNVENMDILIVDDMISSGDSMLDIGRELKKRKAGRIFCAATFGLFTSGLERFDQAHAEGICDAVLTSNLIYLPPELLAKPWFCQVDCSKFVALLIDALNHDSSLGALVDQTQKIDRLLEKYNKKAN